MKVKPPGYQYHPKEIAFSGFSNSGKTTVLAKLTAQLSDCYDIGYVKHQAHKFQIDHKGKDSHSLFQSGASEVVIADSEHHAQVSRGLQNKLSQGTALLDCDFVFVEGSKQSQIPKFVVLDSEKLILAKIESGELTNVIGLIGQDKHPPQSSSLPYFHRNDIPSIAEEILDYFQKEPYQPKLNGLVLTGGSSSRMKSDKALLSYSNQPQGKIAFDLLAEFTDETFISSQPNQWQGSELEHLPTIADSIVGAGPLGGILSAMLKYPQASWMVVACDLPFLDRGTVRNLVEERDTFKMATYFRSVNDQLPEPLCAIYEGKSKAKLFTAMGLGIYCPRKILLNIRGKEIIPQNSKALDNINYRHQYQEIIEEGQPYENH